MEGIRKLGLVNVSFTMLEKALGLDNEHKIVGAFVGQSGFLANTISLKIAGPDCPQVWEGQNCPVVKMVNGRIGRFS